MKKWGKNEFVYLWIAGVVRLHYERRPSLASGTCFFFCLFVFLMDLHNP